VTCCEHTSPTTCWMAIGRLGLGGPRAGYSPVVVQQVGDAHQVVGEHGGAHQDLETLAALERAPLHPAAAEQHRDAALNAGAESLPFLNSLLRSRASCSAVLCPPRCGMETWVTPPFSQDCTFSALKKPRSAAYSSGGLPKVCW